MSLHTVRPLVLRRQDYEIRELVLGHDYIVVRRGLLAGKAYQIGRDFTEMGSTVIVEFHEHKGVPPQYGYVVLRLEGTTKSWLTTETDASSLNLLQNG